MKQTICFTHCLCFSFIGLLPVLKTDSHANDQNKMTLLILEHVEAPITTAANDILKHFFHCFSEKIRLDISCQIQMKHQALFSLKDNVKKK